MNTFAGAPVRDISGRLPDVVGDDPAAAFGAAAARFGDAAGGPGAMDRILSLPWGAMTGHTFLRFAAFDLLVHARDLATTIEADLDVPGPVVEEVASFARRVPEAGSATASPSRRRRPRPPVHRRSSS
jgi:hypothetical protein